jgi:hypothetical protein
MREHRTGVSASPYLVALQSEGPIETDRTSYLLNGRYSLIDQTGEFLTGKKHNIRFADVTGRYTIQGDDITCSITGLFTYDSGEIVPLRNVEHTWSNIAGGARCLGYSDFFNHPIDVSAGYTRYINEEGTPEDRERYSAVSQIYVNMDFKQQMAGLPVDMGFGINLKTYMVELNERFTRFLSLEMWTVPSRLFISSLRLNGHPSTASRSIPALRLSSLLIHPSHLSPGYAWPGSPAEATGHKSAWPPAGTFRPTPESVTNVMPERYSWCISPLN